jgi:hypothetical protein
MNAEFLIENRLETLPVPCTVLARVPGLQDDVADRYFLPCPFIFWFGHL